MYTSNKRLEKFWELVDGRRENKGGLWTLLGSKVRRRRLKRERASDLRSRWHDPHTPFRTYSPSGELLERGRRKDRQGGKRHKSDLQRKPSKRKARQLICLISPRVWGTSWLQFGASKSRSWVFVLARTFNVHFFGCVAYPKREQCWGFVFGSREDSKNTEQRDFTQQLISSKGLILPKESHQWPLGNQWERDTAKVEPCGTLVMYVRCSNMLLAGCGAFWMCLKEVEEKELFHSFLANSWLNPHPKMGCHSEVQNNKLICTK